MTVDVDALHAELTEGYGFRVPRELALAIAAADGASLYDAFGISWCYELKGRWAPRDLYPSGYIGCVPDLIIVAYADGYNDGFVLHAPELDIDPLPVFGFDPMYSTMSVPAVNVRNYVLLNAAQRVWLAAESGEPYDLATYARIASALDLPEHPPDAWDDERITYVPPVPRGYRYVPTEDTIGVLAPEATFGGKDVEVDVYRAKYLNLGSGYLEVSEDAHAMVESLLDDCRRVLAAGFPGTALVGVRRLSSALDDTGGASGAQSIALYDVWTAVNEALGRSVLADATRHRRDFYAAREYVSTRWVAAIEMCRRLPRDQSARVDELAGPQPPNLDEDYKLRYAAVVDQVVREHTQ